MAELDIWLRIIEDQGITGWLKFYESSLKQPVSDTEGLSWAIQSYGRWPVVEGILAASKKKMQGDPLPYVLSVATAKWKEDYIESTADAKYKRGLERSKQRVVQQNEELQDKLEKARRVVSEE
jgi:hypothetical protein